MPDKAWKRAERTVAKDLGTTRASPFRRPGPDVETSWVVVEVKWRKHLPKWLTDGMAQAKRYAKLKKLPILLLKEGGEQGALVVMNYEDFKAWFGDFQKHQDQAVGEKKGDKP